SAAAGSASIGGGRRASGAPAGGGRSAGARAGGRARRRTGAGARAGARAARARVRAAASGGRARAVPVAARVRRDERRGAHQAEDADREQSAEGSRVVHRGPGAAGTLPWAARGGGPRPRAAAPSYRATRGVAGRGGGTVDLTFPGGARFNTAVTRSSISKGFEKKTAPQRSASSRMWGSG